ncbi:DUF6455 family protein [Microvirga sp. G4-2]|uniref:DUF6455 family protein n=1 Tax=Microvirga sp. G4-2 TaxID=3434467 RepID=UPI004044B6C9
MRSETPRKSTPRTRVRPMSRWVERQSRLFERMMERVGADPGATVREAYDGGFAAACRRCLACRHSTDCQCWLESGGSDCPPLFCPNEVFLNRVRRSHTGNMPATQG